jgi:hypothetical protein
VERARPARLSQSRRHHIGREEDLGDCDDIGVTCADDDGGGGRIVQSLVGHSKMVRTDSSHLAVFELRTWSTNILLLAVTEGVKQRVRLETSV